MSSFHKKIIKKYKKHHRPSKNFEKSDYLMKYKKYEKIVSFFNVKSKSFYKNLNRWQLKNIL